MNAPEADATSTWNSAASGNWNDPTKWSSNPNFPNNGNGGVATYAAVVNAVGAAYIITLGVPITIESLTLSSADATIDHTAGTFTATSGITLSAGKYQLNGGTISNTTINESGTGVLTFTSNSANLLTGVTVNGDLTLSANTARTKIAGGTTFTTAHLSGVNSGLGFAPGQTLSGTILFEGAAGGNRNVEMNGTAGAFTIGASGVIRSETGLSASAQIGGSQNYGGAMALTNNGLISSQVSGNTLTVQPNSLTNNGTLQALNGGILTISPTSTWTNAGTISLDATSTVNLGGTFNTTSGIGTFSNTAGGTVNITGTINNTGNTITLNNNTGSWTLNGGTFSGGTLGFADGKTLLFTSNSGNVLTGLTVNGDLTLSANTARTKIAGGTTFTTAHLSGVNSGLGFAPGQTLSGTILFEGAAGGNRNVEMNGTAGAFTIGASGVIRSETGLSASGQIGGSQNYGGAMALTNNGLISSQVSGNTLTIQPDTLTNNGTLQALNGGILSISPANTWSNAGTITLDATSTVNLGGTFNTTSGIGTFSNTAGGTVNITGTINNTGNTITLNNNTGSWTLNGGTFSGGTLAFADGKTLLLTNNSANLITGVTVNGDLTLSANTARTKIAGGTTFTTAHLSGVNSGLGFAPGQTLSGTILFEGAVGGSRNVEMNGTAGAFTIGASGVIRTETGLSGSGQIGGSQNYGGAMTLTNNGLISSQVNGNTLTIQPNSLTNNATLQAISGGILTIAPTSSWTNAGTISLDATSVVNLGGTFDTTSGIGTFSNTAGGTVNITGTINNTGNTITLNNNTGSWALNGGTFSGGMLAFADGKTLFLTNSSSNLLTGLTVNGDLTLSANTARTKIAGGTTFTNAHLSGVNSGVGFAPGQTLSGTILFEGAVGGSRNVEMNGTAGAFTIGASGVIRTETGLSGSGQIGGSQNYGGAMALTNNGLISSQVNANTLTIQPASFTNAGTLQAINGGLLRLLSGYTQTAGVTRLNNGTLTALDVSNVRQTVTISGGRLEGTGTFNANLNNAGTIAPGLSAGHLTINGDVSLTSTSNIEIEIGGATQSTQYDLLTHAGTVSITLQGTLTLNLINGYSPSGGQMFSILDSNQTLLGAFSNVNNGARLTTADGLGSFQVNYGASSSFDPTDVVLSNFIAIPEPSAIALLALGGFALLALRRSRASKRA